MHNWGCGVDEGKESGFIEKTNKLLEQAKKKNVAAAAL